MKYIENSTFKWINTYRDLEKINKTDNNPLVNQIKRTKRESKVICREKNQSLSFSDTNKYLKMKWSGFVSE